MFPSQSYHLSPPSHILLHRKSGLYSLRSQEPTSLTLWLLQLSLTLLCKPRSPGVPVRSIIDHTFSKTHRAPIYLPLTPTRVEQGSYGVEQPPQHTRHWLASYNSSRPSVRQRRTPLCLLCLCVLRGYISEEGKTTRLRRNLFRLCFNLGRDRSHALRSLVHSPFFQMSLINNLKNYFR